MLPIIFLAFANDKVDNARYLRNLPRELDGIRNALYEAQEAGLCEVVERANITLEQIFDIFQSKKYENRIAVFHYGGHADGYQLLLENYNSQTQTLPVVEDPVSGLGDERLLGSSTTHSVQIAHGEGLVSFLAKQQSLKVVFFNGCSTQQQSSELSIAGVPCVIGTSNTINDDVATELSIRFYKSLGNGAALDSAWEEAIDYTKTKRGTANLRGLYRKSKDEVSADAFPWQVFYKQGAETVKEWSLPIAVNKADYGLPPIPTHYTLPETPFLFLKRYEKSHAKVFFGRTVFIRKLYEYALDRKSAPIMLLHGQSGVGKSSLLDAGLLPRLSQKAEVVYIRRTPEMGLLGTLKSALGVSQQSIGYRLLSQIAKWFEPNVQQKFAHFAEEIKKMQGGHADEKIDLGVEELQNLLLVWKNIEKRSGKPLVVILDQAEETYTRPMLKEISEQDTENQQDSELTVFLLALKMLFGKQDDLPEGKLILSYRKEFHPEIEKAFEQYSLPKTKLFLEQLSIYDISEVLHKFEHDEALQDKYHISFEKRLPEMLTQDLSSRIESPVAPVLQIILSKFWQNTPLVQAQRLFSLATYRQLKSEGVEMKDFFMQQMKQLEKHLPNAVASGLVIDILQKHISQMGTANSYSIEALREHYQHRQTEIDQLVPQLSELSLLNEIWKSTQEAPQAFDFEAVAATILTHDTLAPIVQEEYNQSGKQGQRAARILKAKMTDLASVSEADRNAIYLDETDLATVQSGREGMSKWNEAEQALISKSEQRIARQKAVQKTIRRVGAAAVITILLTAIFAFYQMRQASQRATEATLALAKADSANAKNEKLINAFYFYDGKFAVAFKDKQFYFIDKEGNEIAKLGKYKEANNFDYDGWAYVSKEDGKEYLLDTLGNTYRVAYNIADLSPEIEALDLRNKEQASFPLQALQYPKLKILMIDRVKENAKIAIPKQINQLQALSYLKLRYCEIDNLPPTFFELKNLTYLDLRNNYQLSTLPAKIGELKSLTYLDISNNYQLSTLPAQIGELKNLTTLNLINNALQELPVQIGELKNLTTLYLGGNQLSTLPAQIGELKNLTYLDLQSNQLSTLTAQIGELKNLTYLDLGSNQLSSLPVQIWELKNLTTLYLFSNQLSSLPAQIGELKNLTNLGLSGNKLTTLPAQIGELKSLTDLDLSGNQLSTLPTQIGELTNLIKLGLSINQLIILHTQIGELKKLTHLDLSGNKLSSLPAQIGELKNLTYLELSSNQLTTLPTQIGELKNLTDLDLSSNQFKELPTQIWELKNLTTLDLGSSQLKELPIQIWELKNLTTLDLGNNQLTTLPNQIIELKNLTALDLSSNQLTTLPTQIGELKNLTELYLSGNQFKELPTQIGELKNLKALSFSNNPLSITEIDKALQSLPQLESLSLGDLGLRTLPASVLRLKNLKTLDLSNTDDKKKNPNTLSPAEQEKIRKLLPACTLSF